MIKFFKNKKSEKKPLRKSRNENKSKVSEKYSEKYFSNDYFEARKKFRELAESRNMECWYETIQDDLTIDFAYNNPGSEKLFIIVSGVHGVEGYAGSALQLFFLDKIYPYFKDLFAVLLIHSYNPYGFKNNRRVNENNVDLNRNCLEEYSYEGAVDKKFKEFFLKNKKIFSPECPRKNNLLEESKYSVQLAKIILRHGVEGTIRAGSLGQNLYPKGVGFIGLNEEKSTKIFKDTLIKFAPQFKKYALLDIHTGLGRRNNISAYSENPKNSKEFLLMKQEIKHLESRKFSKIESLSHRGAITQYFYDVISSNEKISIIMEIGTASHVSPSLSLMALSRANLEENQITHFGPKNKLEKARKKLKRVYFPNAKRHRRVILKKSEIFLEKMCCQIEKM